MPKIKDIFIVLAFAVLAGVCLFLFAPLTRADGVTMRITDASALNYQGRTHACTIR